MKAEEDKCYVCGSAKHLAEECDRPKKDGIGFKGSSKSDQAKKGKSNTGSKGKSDGKGKPSVNSLTKEDDEKQESKSERRLV